METETKLGTAHFFGNLDGFSGEARLYSVDPPIERPDYFDEGNDESFDFVIVSATVGYNGPETYIFGASGEGEILDWLELLGSFQGGLDHAGALRRAGYEIFNKTNPVGETE